MHVTTSSEIIIQQHHVHGNSYFYNFSVLFVFYYSPNFLFKINNSFNFITRVIIVIIVIVCETLIASSTSKSSCSIIVFPAPTIHEVVNRIKRVRSFYNLNKNNNKNQIRLIPYIPFFNIPPHYFHVSENSSSLVTQNQPIQETRQNDDRKDIRSFSRIKDQENNGSSLNYISLRIHGNTLKKVPLKYFKTNEICNATKKLKSKNTNVRAEWLLNKKITEQRNQCKVKTHHKFESGSCVPKVCYYVGSSSNRSIERYHVGAFPSQTNTGCKTIVKNICKRRKNETRGYLLSKGNKRSLPKDRQIVIDMSKVERHTFTTGTTVILTLNPSAFLPNIKKSCNLMKTLIRSSVTQAQCARHPRRHKEVGQ